MPEPRVFVPRCGYCNNIITGDILKGCPTCHGDQLCDLCHLPRTICGCASAGPAEDTSPITMLNELHKMAADIINKKNHDYRGAMEDDYANFRGSKALGIHPGHGVLLRIQDKMMRVKTFIDKGELKVKGESIDDALVDITNYCALLRGIIKTEDK